MTKSDKGSEIAAIFNKETFKQRLEMRKGSVRMSGASLFLVVERKSWSMWQKKSDEEDNDRRQPKLGGLVDQGKDSGFYSERNWKQSLETYEQRHGKT